MKYLYYYQTDIGELAIAEENNSITNLYFKNGAIIKEKYTIRETALLNNAYVQLIEYLSGTREKFNLPLDPLGTSFYLRVWKCLLDIPYGQTRSYKEIAEKINNNKAYRAVGNANNKNPIPIFIPCHRVISDRGELSGYRGGVDIKRCLLKLEKNNNKCLEPRQEEKNTL